MLEVMLNEAEIAGDTQQIIRAGDLHNRVVKEDGVVRITSACSAMRKKAKEKLKSGGTRGELIDEPDSGNGHNTTYRFLLGD